MAFLTPVMSSERTGAAANGLAAGVVSVVIYLASRAGVLGLRSFLAAASSSFANSTLCA